MVLLSFLKVAVMVSRFSNAKKCSNGGRGLMQLDFTQFLSKLEKLTSIRPVPGREYVEDYIKAYYLPETALEDWITRHKVSSHISHHTLRSWNGLNFMFDMEIVIELGD
jgi:hypothetical protein